ncbi:hypothetical protein [Propionicimonas sp. T2.31MG-18]|uniref:hypothetical protein n=1 Tax=Propionicimonas sp. T2.31MG-18 TaxID=3157620 RepID=UPI00367130C2
MTQFWAEAWYWLEVALAFFAWPVSLIVLGYWFWPWREGRRLARGLRGRALQVTVLGAMTAATSYASALWDSSMLAPLPLDERCGEGALRSTWNALPLSYVCVGPEGDVELVGAWTNPVVFAGLTAAVTGMVIAGVATVSSMRKAAAYAAAAAAKRASA